MTEEHRITIHQDSIGRADRVTLDGHDVSELVRGIEVAWEPLGRAVVTFTVVGRLDIVTDDQP